MKRTRFAIALAFVSVPFASPTALAEIAAGRPVEGAAPVTLSGMVLSKSGDCFSLSVQGGRRKYWLGVGESQGGVKVTGYDKKTGVLSVNYQGKDFTIRLAAARNDGLPLKPTPNFVRASQVIINGWENLAKLSPERRRLALEKINATLEAFDKSVGPISAKQLNQAEKYEAEEAKEQKEDPEFKKLSDEANTAEAKKLADEAKVKPEDTIDETNLPKVADKTQEEQEPPVAPSGTEETDDTKDDPETATKDSEKAAASKNDEEEGGLSENPALRKQNLTIEVNDAPGGSASVVIDDWQDTGGAHGNHALSVLNFIGSDDTPATLATLLASDKTDGPALVRLSKLSEIALLKSGFTPDKDGLKPTAENFSNLALTRYGFRVIFPPYQVGTFADGTKKVYLPAGSLDGVVSPKVKVLWNDKAK